MKFARLLVVLSCLCLAAPASSADKGAAPGLSAKDRCAVCGMFVAKTPNWACEAKIRGGPSFWFDGPRDMFKFYLEIGKYAKGRSRADVVALLVRDYYTLAWIDAEKAFYVIGSNVSGPMGGELVPFLKKADAAAFQKEHKGWKIVSAREVTLALLETL